MYIYSDKVYKKIFGLSGNTIVSNARTGTNMYGELVVKVDLPIYGECILSTNAEGDLIIRKNDRTITVKLGPKGYKRMQGLKSECLHFNPHKYTDYFLNYREKTE
jgi:hypothetical protein